MKGREKEDVIREVREIGQDGLLLLKKSELEGYYSALYGFEANSTIKANKRNIVKEIVKFVNNLVYAYEASKDENMIIDSIASNGMIANIVDKYTLAGDIQSEIENKEVLDKEKVVMAYENLTGRRVEPTQKKSYIISLVREFTREVGVV